MDLHPKQHLVLWSIFILLFLVISYRALFILTYLHIKCLSLWLFWEVCRSEQIQYVFIQPMDEGCHLLGYGLIDTHLRMLSPKYIWDITILEKNWAFKDRDANKLSVQEQKEMEKKKKDHVADPWFPPA